MPFEGTFDGTADRVWILDPVDGTKGFMRGEHYCIALALLKEGESSKERGVNTSNHGLHEGIERHVIVATENTPRARTEYFSSSILLQASRCCQ